MALPPPLLRLAPGEKTAVVLRKLSQDASAFDLPADLFSDKSVKESFTGGQYDNVVTSYLVGGKIRLTAEQMEKVTKEPGSTRLGVPIDSPASGKVYQVTVEMHGLKESVEQQKQAALFKKNKMKQRLVSRKSTTEGKFKLYICICRTLSN